MQQLSISEDFHNAKIAALSDPEKMKDYWQTPDCIKWAVCQMFGFDWFDPCPANPQVNGLEIPWNSKAYINPPFSEYLKWTKHGLLQPTEQIWIMHHDSSTDRMQHLILASSAMCLLYDRVKFVDPRTGRQSKSSDPAKSQTLIYRGEKPRRFYDCFDHLGFIVEKYQIQ